jgi:hypothetical protein
VGSPDGLGEHPISHSIVSDEPKRCGQDERRAGSSAARLTTSTPTSHGDVRASMASGREQRSRALRRPATRSSPQARNGRPSPRRLRPPGSGRASRSALASVEDAASTEAAARRRGAADAGLRRNRLGVTPIGVDQQRLARS